MYTDHKKDVQCEHNMEEDVESSQNNQRYPVCCLSGVFAIVGFDDRDDGVPYTDTAQNAHGRQDVLVLLRHTDGQTDTHTHMGEVKA